VNFDRSFTASALALGILVTYIIGAFTEWFILAWILSTFPLVLFFGMILMPETPIWLLAHNQENDAKKSLQRLRGK
jgi:facilitated trehalose transporter